MVKRQALGRGIGSLIPREAAEKIASINEIDISLIVANPYQPRLEFDDELIEDLANSINELGIIQPLTLRQLNDDEYQIIAGERRFRAAKKVGLKKVPAYIRTADNDEMLEMALVENIQREDLNAIEVSLSYQRLIDEFSLTQDELAKRVGKNRATVANFLRLLRLPPAIQKGVRDKDITMGHAKALLSIDDEDAQLMLYKQIIAHDFTVRKTEELVRNLEEEAEQKDNRKDEKRATKFTSEYDLAVKELFGRKAKVVVNSNGKGKIVIPFASESVLKNLLAEIDKK
ncbi:MAG: ParB/RepB/Spo0J family partition protein [Bacteroidales bacterium]